MKRLTVFFLVVVQVSYFSSQVEGSSEPTGYYTLSRIENEDPVDSNESTQQIQKRTLGLLGATAALNVVPTFVWSPWPLVKLLGLTAAAGGAASAVAAGAAAAGAATGVAGTVGAIGAARFARRLPDIFTAFRNDHELRHLVKQAGSLSLANARTTRHILHHGLHNLYTGLYSYNQKQKKGGGWSSNGGHSLGDVYKAFGELRRNDNFSLESKPVPKNSPLNAVKPSSLTDTGESRVSAEMKKEIDMDTGYRTITIVPENDKQTLNHIIHYALID